MTDVNVQPEATPGELKVPEPIAVDLSPEQRAQKVKELQDAIDSLKGMVKNQGFLPEPTDAPPPWAKPLPDGVIAPNGRSVTFCKFRGVWTDTPAKGERQCVIWPLSAGDKRFALGRSMGDPNRHADELAKQMIRAFDMSKDGPLLMPDAAGSGDGGQIEIFWNEIGERCRSLLVRAYTQLHYLRPGELSDFLDNCIAVRSVRTG